MTDMGLINGQTPEQRLRALAETDPTVRLERWEVRWAIDEINSLRRKLAQDADKIQVLIVLLEELRVDSLGDAIDRARRLMTLADACRTERCIDYDSELPQSIINAMYRLE
jgi:hypothetical protein